MTDETERSFVEFVAGMPVRTLAAGSIFSATIFWAADPIVGIAPEFGYALIAVALFLPILVWVLCGIALARQRSR